MQMPISIKTVTLRSVAGLRLAAAIAAALALITVGAARVAQAEEIDSVVASVDGEPITSQDVTQFSSQNPSGGAGGGTMPSSLTPSSGDPDAVLKAIITQKMLDSESKNYADRVDDDEIDRYIANLEAQGKVTDAQLRAQLQQQGLSYDDFRAKVRKQVEAMAMIDKEVRQKIVIPEAEITQYYKDNPEDFTTTDEKYDLAQILIAVPAGATPQQIAAAQQKAEEIHEKILKGGDFAALAMQYSDDDSKSKGGELGEFAPGDLNDAILAAVTNLKPGDITPVVKTRYGFHIVKVESHQKPGLQPLDAVRGQIREQLLTFHAKQAFQKWVDNELIKQHYVETLQQ
jgi:peptidyl-prolyl cis-trans isomerase SurA